MNRLRTLLAFALVALPGVAASETTALLADGPFAALMARGVQYDSQSDLDTGFGGMISGGARRGPLAFEVGGSYTAGGHGAKALGGAFRGLFFPIDTSGLYLLAGAGLQNVKDHPDLGNTDFNLVTVDAGLGYLFPIGRRLGLRAELFYEYGDRQDRDHDQRPPQPNLPVPGSFDDVVLQVGLHLPFGAPPPPPPVETPVAVVAPAAICSDTQDNDGDGQTDFPADPGCAAADDSDETDPPPPPPPPCRTPAPGERVSLAGCGTGDTIVLRGVNFDFDRSSLTINAKTILDNVAEELARYPGIKVEVGGHTDAKGSDDYNQKLSDRRAASVLHYLEEKGVASDRLTSAGYGESRPVADNETDDGRELNRRVELKITDGLAGADAAPAAVVPAEPPPPG